MKMWKLSHTDICDSGETQTMSQLRHFLVISCLPNVGVDCSACLSCGMIVLSVMTGCRLFHILMVLGNRDVLNTCVRA